MVGLDAFQLPVSILSVSFFHPCIHRHMMPGDQDARFTVEAFAERSKVLKNDSNLVPVEFVAGSGLCLSESHMSDERENRAFRSSSLHKTVHIEVPGEAW